MKPGYRLLEEVTEATLRALARELDIKAIDIKGNRSVMATGDIRRIPIGDCILINLGYLRGQTGYSVKAQSTPGLTIEVRLHGFSTAQRCDRTGSVHETHPGDYFIIGQRDSVEWQIEAPPQDFFKTVSISYARDFLAGLDDPGLIAAADTLFENAQHLHGTSPPSLIALAETMFSLRPDQPFEMLRARTLAMSVLVEAMSHQVPGHAPIADSTMQVIDRAHRFIQQNLGADVTVDDVARHCRVSTSSLKNAFRSAGKEQIGTVIKERRMRAADQLLRSGVAIADVARTLRYSAPESLARAYGRHFGHPPSHTLKMRKVSD